MPTGVYDRSKMQRTAEAPAVFDEKKRKFIENYAKHGIISTAARYAGVSHGTAAGFLKEFEVQKALEEIRKEVMTKIGYGLQEAMQEAQDAIDFARDTDNANAYVKAVELRAKLNNLLVDKIDLSASVGFSINIVGIRRKKEAEAITAEVVPALPPPVETEQNAEEDPWS
jgi:phage terminase small subunit